MINQDKKLPKLISWIGGKHFMVGKLLPLIPKHDTYIEPFVGGGSLFFAKQPAKINVIADTETSLINFYKGVAKGELCKYTNTWPDTWTQTDKLKYLQKIENKARKNLNSLSPFEYLIYIKMLPVPSNNCIKTQCGMRVDRNQSKIQRIIDSDIINNKLKNCDKYYKLLKNTIILNQDYRTVIKKYDNKNAFIYLDPPYIDSDSRCYENYPKPAEIVKTLTTIKGKFILSYSYYEPLIKIINNKFNIYTIDMYYPSKKVTVEELLITNLKL
ncbi:MAG: DNA adenine methylase [Candidatus Omnitrophica bacterium]|nr:DNA adenine methylase [Candidatus Omnitrophota bacterium]